MTTPMQDVQSIIDLRHDSGQVQRVKHRNPGEISAAYKGGPVEGVCMNDVELLLTLPQLQKEIEKKRRLCEETTIGAVFLHGCRKIGRANAMWDGNGFKLHIGHI